MDETQTPPAPSGRRRNILITLGLVVIIAAGITVGVLIGGSGHHTPVAAASTPSPAPSPSPAPATVSVPTPAPVVHTVAPVPHEVVAAAAPTAFEFKGPAFDIKAHVCGMLNIRPLDPPGEQHHTVCWVQQGFGVAPGTNTATTYVLGHAWGQDSQEVLNNLSSTAMRQVLKERTPVKLSGVDTWPVTTMNGYILTLRTANGTLHYTVKDVYAVRKTDAGNVRPLMDASTPNRVVIITCGELNHYDYDYNIIVDAYLSSSIASKV